MYIRSILIYSFLLFALNTFAASPADLVLRNGIVITMEESMPSAQAIAVSGDRIVWVGSDADAGPWISKSTKVIDLRGAAVYPGLTDSHAHITGLGFSRMSIDLVGTTSKESILQKLKDQVTRTKKGEWIFGRGWDQNDWPEKKFPTAADLDTVAPENLVAFERIDGHASWVNSVTLKMAGITKETKDPEGGKIERDEQGNPTGVLIDNASGLLEKVMKTVSKEEMIRRTQIALNEAASKGITMIHDAGTSMQDLEAFKTLAERNELPVRIFSMIWMPSDLGESFLKTGPQKYGPYLDVRSIKLIMDGAMGSRGAAMMEPYTDDPKNSGLLMWKDPDLTRVLTAAKEKGIQVGIHSIGDRANRMILDEYEKIGVKGLRWRIEHAQLLNLADIPRFAELGVIASMQPVHATSDMPWFADRVGPERTKNGAYVWRSLLKHNTLIAGGSDAPVEDINPLWGFYAAITRQDQKGQPAGGWMPEQIVTRDEALRMFTVNAAYTSFHENDLGSLKAGKYADMIVLPQNIMTCDPKALIDMKVMYTIVGGQIRYPRQ